MFKIAKNNKSKTTFTIEHGDLSPEQLRLTKSLITELITLIETNNEDQFFQSSAELMRLISSAIEFSSFVDYQKNVSTIPFSKQAIEYSIDVLAEFIEQNKHIQYDN